MESPIASCCHETTCTSGADLGGFLRFPETAQVIKIIFYSDLQWYKSSDRNTLIEQSATPIDSEQSHFVFLLRAVSS